MQPPPVFVAASRRDFLRAGATTAAGLTVSSAFAPSVHAAGSDTLKVALVGCGNRGTGAAIQALSTAGPTTLWAMADAFDDRLQLCLKRINRELADLGEWSAKSFGTVDVPKDRQFIGLDAYRKAIDSADVILLAEPPGYRPQHFEYAIKSGKHVFMEKPVATDPAGIRRVLAAAEEAKKKNLKVGVGLQRRHQPSYLEAIDRFRNGEIGDLVTLRCSWNSGPPAKNPGTRRHPSRPTPTAATQFPSPVSRGLCNRLRKPTARARTRKWFTSTSSMLQCFWWRLRQWQCRRY